MQLQLLRTSPQPFRQNTFLARGAEVAFSALFAPRALSHDRGGAREPGDPKQALGHQQGLEQQVHRAAASSKAATLLLILLIE